MSIFDTDGDGIGDVVAYDTTGEGVADTWQIDTDHNGFVDQTAWDTSGDGVADVLGIDANENGRFEGVAGDSNVDGYLETMAIDANEDGVTEQGAMDTNADGVFETHVVDSNGDGVADSVAATQPTAYQDNAIVGGSHRPSFEPTVEGISIESGVVGGTTNPGYAGLGPSWPGIDDTDSAEGVYESRTHDTDGDLIADYFDAEPTFDQVINSDNDHVPDWQDSHNNDDLQY